MTTLRNTISQLASTFAAGVLNAIRSASLEEILEESGGAPRRGPGRPRGSQAASRDGAGVGSPSGGRSRGRRGRLGRRSAKDIAGVVESIVSLLERKPKGLRAEQIRHELGLEAKELPRPIAEALSGRKITKQGQKRATTYFARGAAKTTSPKRSAKAAGKGSKGAKKGRKTANGKRSAGKGAAGHSDSSSNGASSAEA